MQAVILAAGKSIRTYPLTLERPKPLLKIAGKTILEHNLDALMNIKNKLKEILIVVGYKKEMIEKYFGNNHNGLNLKYIEQKEQLGTGHALMMASSHIKDSFILLMGDNIYSGKDVIECVRHKNSILTARVDNPENYGIIAEKDGILMDIVEKPKNFVSNLISTASYVFDKKFLSYLDKIGKTERNEIEITDAIRLYSKKNKIKCVKSTLWIPIGCPSDLLEADKVLRKGKNIIGANTRINGRVINSNLGDNCIIDGTVKNSIVMNSANILDNSEISRSIIGEKTTFSGSACNAVIGDKVEAKNVQVSSCSVWNNKKISNKAVSEDLK